MISLAGGTQVVDRESADFSEEEYQVVGFDIGVEEFAVEWISWTCKRSSEWLKSLEFPKPPIMWRG